ncbi:MAG: HAD hydrolase family protein [Synechococcales cyanobacterium K44_A2020_017]|nr:HAD hydrolase family protein [Synechococcales cyanobacterium K32_A2020_035]MBF2096528.1 HAD hydrolase family protein [Synechococcales cyanobacterium K44_A2020_017]
MATSPAVLIFTDLDGTLLNADDYGYDAALPVLQALHQQQIPVIPVTSKTRREVAALRQQIAPQDPFIVENGSAIFLTRGDRRFDLAAVHGSITDSTDTDSTDTDSTDTDSTETLQMCRLGCTYDEARRALVELSRLLNIPLQGFGDLSAAALQDLTGLPLSAIPLAQARDFTEPFVMPKTIHPDQLDAAVQQLGMGVVVGDRFSHLIGLHAGKGRAVRLLVAAYQSVIPEQSIYTIGLGNSPNDLEMLEAVDLPMVIPGSSGAHPALSDRGWQIAPESGSRGWAIAVQQALQENR